MRVDGFGGPQWVGCPIVPIAGVGQRPHRRSRGGPDRPRQGSRGGFDQLFFPPPGNGVLEIGSGKRQWKEETNEGGGNEGGGNGMAILHPRSTGLIQSRWTREDKAPMECQTRVRGSIAVSLAAGRPCHTNSRSVNVEEARDAATPCSPADTKPANGQPPWANGLNEGPARGRSVSRGRGGDFLIPVACQPVPAGQCRCQAYCVGGSGPRTCPGCVNGANEAPQWLHLPCKWPATVSLCPSQALLDPAPCAK